MAMTTIAALFDTYSDGQAAVQDLENAGVPHSDISIVANDAHGTVASTLAPGADLRGDLRGEPTELDPPEHTEAASGASLGTILGGGAGLLAGIGTLAIPGVGPVVAAGWLIATLTGAGAGAGVGGLLGSLIHHGVDHDHAHVYAEGVRRGGALVTVRIDDLRNADIRAMLNRHHPADVTTRAATYRDAGWSQFDEQADPYSASEIEQHRRDALAGRTVGTTGMGATGVGTTDMGLTGMGTTGRGDPV